MICVERDLKDHPVFVFVQRGIFAETSRAEKKKKNVFTTPSWKIDFSMINI